MTGNSASRAEAIAEQFHLTYDEFAPAFGWEPQAKTRKRTWRELPEENRDLMVAVVVDLLTRGVIR